RRPDDVEMLEKYAEALLLVRPLEPRNIGAAIGAYRRLLRLDPEDEFLYEQLAKLYTAIGDLDELGYIAQKRLEYQPDDPKASIWLSQALIAQHKPNKVRQILLALTKKLEEQDEKHQQYVQACALLSGIAARKEADQARMEAVKWLDRAVAYDPQSAEALMNRARFYRIGPVIRGQTRESMLAAARSDLQRASALESKDPQVHLILSIEWLEHGRLDLAAAELDATKDLDEAAVAEYFVDPNNWAAARFLQAAELAMRSETASESV
ncbi:unnamed protein product, partial [marine sediment metagenome]